MLNEPTPHESHVVEVKPAQLISKPELGTEFVVDPIVVDGQVLRDVVIDVKRHAGQAAPKKPIPNPDLGLEFVVDEAVIDAFPVPGSRLVEGRYYGMSLWGRTAKITVELPGGEIVDYFLKAEALGDIGRTMIEGEYESLKAIHGVDPAFAPFPYAWGKYRDAQPDTYFLLAEFREVGQQPPDPKRFTARLAAMHKKSESPTGKFGFHVVTCHAKLPQITDCWEDSWEVLYRKQLAYMIELDEEKHGLWPEFQHVCRLTLEKLIPRLLRPLQSDGRSIKPCLLHGNLWDENTATDMVTRKPFIYDGSSFYGHNEYEIGNWRAPRHRLSNRKYVRNYKRVFHPSEPKKEWNDRNLLYSLRYDLATAILIPGCNQRQVVKDNMTLLCKKFCIDDLLGFKRIKSISLRNRGYDEDEEEEEEEAEEEEEGEETPDDATTLIGSDDGFGLGSKLKSIALPPHYRIGKARAYHIERT
ncbi:Fructosamine kinase-domain-containing protein [Diplogelasinospora grovesii]|uniref:protein-ribulosamine 3-kinase n=1 Tax=Diplogelasinospora grovesii TaxID=303347 RepID=A0AAN6NAH7_9PEZI|nr:Fructosamine kinase-domain-containing protein [Diplogelasinospora grovesii]